MNKYYNYPNKYVWDKKTWEPKLTCIIPLCRWMQVKTKELYEDLPPYDFSRYKERVYYPHELADAFPEVEKYWEEKGVRYNCYCLGGFYWIAMVPVSHYSKENEELPVILRFHYQDHLNRDWAMNTVEFYKDYNEMAAKDNCIVIYLVTKGLDINDRYNHAIQEIPALFHVELEKFYLDVSTVYETGNALKDIPGFTLKDIDGNIVKDPDSRVRRFGSLDIPVLDIRKIWANMESLNFQLIDGDRASNVYFDREYLYNTMCGRYLAEGMDLVYRFNEDTDPNFIKYFDDMGLVYERHKLKSGVYWLSLIPKQALEEPEKKLPLLAIFMEVNGADPHQIVNNVTYHLEWLKIAAQGDFAVVFFAMETRDENEMMHDVIEQASKLYPIDLSRVYLTGHSHNGWFASMYARTHWREIAGLAHLGNAPGMVQPKYLGQKFEIPEDEFEAMHTYDMPTIGISGDNEHHNYFPLHSEASGFRPNVDFRTECNDRDDRINSWQRRLYSHNCPMKTHEEILATKDSSNYVERKMGFPADKTDVLYMDGYENYIADIRNNDGNYHLRVVCLGGMPHTVTHTMVTLGWSFLRRFKRDLETGDVIELY